MRTEEVSLTVRVALDVKVVEITRRRGRNVVVIESEGQRFTMREGDKIELKAEVGRSGTTGTWGPAA